MFSRDKPISTDYVAILGRVRGSDTARHTLNTTPARHVSVNPNNSTGPKKRLQVVNPGAQTGTTPTKGAPYPDNMPGRGIFGRADLKAR